MILGKNKLPVLLTAAAIAVTAAGLAGCGDKKSDSSSELSAGEYTEEESSSIEQAKEIVANWYSLMNEAKYSEAIRLMTPGYAEQLGYDGLVDGEGSNKVDFEIADDGALLSTDGSGNIIVGLSITETTEGDEEGKEEIMMYVTFYENGGLISSGANIEPAPTKSFNNGPDLSAEATEAASAAYAAAEKLLSDQQAAGETLPADGEYTSGDGSAIAESMDKAAAESAAEGVNIICTVTVKDGKAAYVRASAAANDGMSVIAVYPPDAAES